MANSPKVHQEPLDNTDHQLRQQRTWGSAGDLWDGRSVQGSALQHTHSTYSHQPSVKTPLIQLKPEVGVWITAVIQIRALKPGSSNQSPTQLHQMTENGKKATSISFYVNMTNN